jgi:hypothetical protein
VYIIKNFIYQDLNKLIFYKFISHNNKMSLLFFLSKDIIGIVYKYLLPVKINTIKDECLRNLTEKTRWIYHGLEFKHKKMQGKFYRKLKENIWYLSDL